MGEQPYSDPQAAASSGVSRRRAVLATVILSIAVPAFCAAGLWQLDRAAQKQALLDGFAAALEAPVRDDLHPGMSTAENKFRRFRLTGRYLPERQVLLDNMTQDGVNGYQVLTPFRTPSMTVLVNRGWVRASADRTELPYIEVDDRQRTIVARLNNLPEPGLRLQPGTAATEWPRRLLFPDRAQLAAALGLELPDWQLLLEPDQDDGLLRDWQPLPGRFGPATHRGYALQWFSFAALTVVFYIILIRGWLRDRRSARETVN